MASFLPMSLVLSLQDAKEPPVKSRPSLLKAKEDIPEVSVRLSPIRLDTDITAPPIPCKQMVSSHFSSTVPELPCCLSIGLLPIS